MALTSLDEGLLVVFFIYGLAFFGMGLALALETGRSPALAEARFLHPLAAFGILHGLHEWMEIFLMQIIWLGGQVSDLILWSRLGLLAISFLSLLIYGVQAYHLPTQKARLVTALGSSTLTVYALAIISSAVITYRSGEIPWLRLTDALIRYLLAVTGATLAAVGLHLQAMQARRDGRRPLMINLNWAAWGFAIYGLTQIFVPSLEMIPARWINSDAVLAATGVPIQVIRALMAVIVMVSMIRAIQVVESERQHQLLAAQKARLEALEQIQVELTKREALRRELLRHIVRAQEDERARIARELHDETAQVLTAFSLDLATLQNAVPSHPEVKTLVERLQALGKQMSQGLYRLVHDLRPAQLDGLGLIPTLQYLIEQDYSSKELDVTLDVQGKNRRLDPLIETVLFRVIQEALNNVVRHAHTKQAQISLVYQTQEITLRVMDSGVGFNPVQNFAPPRGWGLAGMRERVESVGGQLNIESSPSNGTIVEVVVPVFDIIP